MLRYLVLFFLLIAFVANVALSPGSSFYQLLLLGQILFFGSALIGYKLRRSQWGRMKLFYGPFYFCLAHTAALLGVLSFLRGDRFPIWQSPREVAQVGEKESLDIL